MLGADVALERAEAWLEEPLRLALPRPRMCRVEAVAKPGIEGIGHSERNTNTPPSGASLVV